MNWYKSSGWFFTIAISLASFSCKKSDANNMEPPGAVELIDNVVADELNFPWEMVWGNDGHTWITERNGKISRFNPATGQVTPVITIAEVVSNGEGGMLGLALSGAAGSPMFLLFITTTMPDSIAKNWFAILTMALRW